MRWNSSLPQQSPLTSPPSHVHFLTWASWDHILYKLLLDQVLDQLSGDLRLRWSASELFPRLRAATLALAQFVVRCPWVSFTGDKRS